MAHCCRFLILLLLPAAVYAEPLLPPGFSHSAGTFTEPFQLELSFGEGETVYYTTDGETPTKTSLPYKEDTGIEISGSMMIRARAYHTEGDSSASVTRIYNQLSYNIAEFDSNLPLVIVNEHNETMLSQCSDIPPTWGTNCDRTIVYISIIDVDDSGRARLLTDDLHVHARSESNYRGNSSLTFPKRQFGIRLIDEEGENRNEPILGMPSENNWILHNPYDDKTLMRNAVAFQLSRDTGTYSPRTRFVELFLHDGNGPVTRDHYHGVYMLVERIKWDNNRVDVAKLTPDDSQEPGITGGYILNHDTYETHIRGSRRNTRFRLVRPQDEDITSVQRNWLSNHIGELEDALFGDNFTDPEVGYAAWLEPESFIDHHLITEGLKEVDGFRKSTYLYKDRGSRIKMGPLWDWNLSMGNTSVGNLNFGCEPTHWYYEDFLAHPDNSPERYLNGWYTRLFEDPDFRERYRERWWVLRRGPLATDHVVNVMREYAEKLDEAQQRNYERWPVMGEWVMFNCEVFDTYQEEVEYMIDWTRQRLQWVDYRLGPPPANTTGTDLRHFWYFGDTMPNNTPLEKLEAHYSLLEKARLHYHSALEGYPFNEEHPQWRKASMERRNRPTELNYHAVGNHGRPFDENAMRALQVRKPLEGSGGESKMIFDLPTTGVEDVVFRFAAMDEGAADELIIDYAASVDGAGEPEWTTEGLQDREYSLSDEYRLFELDFSPLPEVNNNSDFKIRIRFEGEDMSADDGGRVTFNNFSLTSEPDEDAERGAIPETYKLKQNHPNPFNSETVISYQLPEDRFVVLEVFDVLGRRVDTLVNERLDAGVHQVKFDAAALASGIYVYRLQVGDMSSSRMMTYIK